MPPFWVLFRKPPKALGYRDRRIDLLQHDFWHVWLPSSGRFRVCLGFHLPQTVNVGPFDFDPGSFQGNLDL